MSYINFCFFILSLFFYFYYRGFSLKALFNKLPSFVVYSVGGGYFFLDLANVPESLDISSGLNGPPDTTLGIADSSFTFHPTPDSLHNSTPRMGSSLFPLFPLFPESFTPSLPEVPEVITVADINTSGASSISSKLISTQVDPGLNISNDLNTTPELVPNSSLDISVASTQNNTIDSFNQLFPDASVGTPIPSEVNVTVSTEADVTNLSELDVTGLSEFNTSASDVTVSSGVADTTPSGNNATITSADKI